MKMTMPPRRPWPVTDRDRPNPYASVPSDYGPKIDRYVGKAQDFLQAALPYAPIVGPAYDTYHDLREGDYAGAAFNGAMLAADLTPVAPYLKALKMLRAVNDMRRGRLLARADTQAGRLRTIGAVPPGYQIHHTIPIKGWGPISGTDRKTEGLLRNHPFNLKILPKDIHNGVHHGFGNRYTDPALKLWHGTNAVHKSTAAFAGARAADTWENNRPAKPVATKKR